MSDSHLLKIMAYMIVAITVITMIFGVFAYYLYKIRERRRMKHREKISGPTEREEEKRSYSYFESRRIVL